MVVSSTLVNVSEDAELRLVSLLAQAAPAGQLGATFQQDCESCITNGDAAALLKTIIGDKGAIAAITCSNSASTLLPKEDAIAAVSILAALLERTDDSVALAQSLADAVMDASSSSSKQDDDEETKKKTILRKISVLSILYNMRSSAREKCALLERMFRLAGTFPTQLLSESSVLGSLLVSSSTAKTTSATTSATAAAATTTLSTTPTKASAAATTTTAAVPPQLCTLIDSWQGGALMLEASQRRQLYQTVATVLPAGDLRKQHFLLLVTESYTDDKSASSPEALETARQVAMGAIRDPVTLFVHQRNLLDQPAIRALEQKDAALHGLLKVFQQGKISDYQAYCQAQGGEEALLAKYQLDAAACQKYMRILSLCSLAGEHEEIPYQVIAETLQLNNNDNVQQQEVESWVIAAVSSGLLQAKMDQLKETVMVERCVVRQFDTAQWKALQSRLTAWKQNVASILASLQENQAALAASGGAAAAVSS